MPYIRLISQNGVYAYKGKMFQRLDPQTKQPIDHHVSEELRKELVDDLEDSPFRDVDEDGNVIFTDADEDAVREEEAKLASRTILSASVAKRLGKDAALSTDGTEVAVDAFAGDDVIRVGDDDPEIAALEKQAEDMAAADEAEAAAEEAAAKADAAPAAPAANPADKDGDGHDDKTGQFVKGNKVSVKGKKVTAKPANDPTTEGAVEN